MRLQVKRESKKCLLEKLTQHTFITHKLLLTLATFRLALSAGIRPFNQFKPLITGQLYNPVQIMLKRKNLKLSLQVYPSLRKQTSSIWMKVQSKIVSLYLMLHLLQVLLTLKALKKAYYKRKRSQDRTEIILVCLSTTKLWHRKSFKN